MLAVLETHRITLFGMRTVRVTTGGRHVRWP